MRKYHPDFVTREELLKETFVFRDLKTFKHMPDFLENPRLFELYPQAVCDAFEEMLWIGGEPKKKLSGTAFRAARRLLRKGLIRDALAARKV